LAFSIGLVYYAFSILVGPLEDEFGWSRSRIMDAPMIWVFVTAIFMIPAGKLNDRFGPRLVMPIGALLAGVGLVTMGYMQLMWHYRVAHAILALGMTGMSQPICMGSVARWFEKYRGMAMGSTIAGGAVGAFIASRLWPPLLEAHGIRSVYFACAAVSLFILFPYMLLVMRRAPEDYGLLPFGASERPTSKAREEVAHAVEGLSSAEARRTTNFWLILAFTLFANLAYNAVFMHFVPIFEAGGVARERASHLLGYTILLSFIGKVTGGWVADHVSIRKFLAVTHAGFALACTSLFFAGTTWQLPLFVLMWGMCLGFSAGGYAALMPECFGTRELSTIMSQFMILQVLGSGFGPKLSGIIYDKTQSYAVAFVTAATLYALTAMLIFMTRPKFLAASKRKVEQAPPSVSQQ
jgi:MFS family permease